MSAFVKVLGCRPRPAGILSYGDLSCGRTALKLGGGHKTARGERAYPAAPATRIRRPKKLGRSGESPVPQPWSISAEPVKVGDEWHVLARHPSGQLVRVRRFKTQSEAKFWIARKSKAWLKKQ
jgi:hypothetical protein